MNMNKLITILTLLLYAVTGNAQCATDEYIKANYTTEQIQQAEQATRQYAQVARKTTNQGYTIPVVVHIIYNNYAQQQAGTRVQDNIDVINEDFNRLNPNRDNTWPQAASANISFCLQEVRMVETDVYEFNTSDRMKRSDLGGSDRVDSVLNVWVCNLTPGLLGYATYPWYYRYQPTQDGVVVGWQYFGRGTGSLNGGRTLTHEIGHWLDLRHIWGAGGCTQDDFIADTPPSDGPNYGCPRGTISCGTTDMVENYMDYTNDPCMNLFTQGQVNLMHTALSGVYNRPLKNCFTPITPEPICNLLELPTPTLNTTGIKGDENSITDGDTTNNGRFVTESDVVTFSFLLPDSTYICYVDMLDGYFNGVDWQGCATRVSVNGQLTSKSSRTGRISVNVDQYTNVLHLTWHDPDTINFNGRIKPVEVWVYGEMEEVITLCGQVPFTVAADAPIDQGRTPNGINAANDDNLTNTNRAIFTTVDPTVTVTCQLDNIYELHTIESWDGFDNGNGIQGACSRVELLINGNVLRTVSKGENDTYVKFELSGLTSASIVQLRYSIPNGNNPAIKVREIDICGSTSGNRETEPTYYNIHHQKVDIKNSPAGLYLREVDGKFNKHLHGMD
jgi:hypothetical protein